MHFSVASRHFPDAEGTAAGRILYATCEGLLSEGHRVDVMSWGPEPPSRELPAWCAWRPLRPESGLPVRLRTIARPRSEAGRLGWEPAPGAVAVADDPPSFSAVEGSDRSVVTFHYLTRLDARAVGRVRAGQIQDQRGEWRAARRAAVVLAYSPRVARALSARTTFVPAAYPLPAEPLELTPDPVAAIVSDWRWPPNALALGWLLEAWPEVRARVPAARLLLAGWGLERVAAGSGVEILGVPSRSVDVLARASVLAFPCPDSSGPKVKVMEAFALGVPVVTTPPGVEGIVAPPGAGAVVVPRSDFAAGLASVLSEDPARRAEIGARGREALAASHAAIPAARARIAAIEGALAGADRSERAEG